MNEQQNPKMKLVFAGVCELTSGKRGGTFYPITEEQIERGKLPKAIPEEKIFSWEVGRACGRPGAIHEFEYPAERPNSIYPNSRRFLGRLSKDDRVIAWQAKHDAFLAHAEMLAKEKIEKNVNLIQEQLEPLRIVFRSLSPRSRAAFLGQIIAYLTTKS